MIALIWFEEPGGWRHFDGVRVPVHQRHRLHRSHLRNVQQLRRLHLLHDLQVNHFKQKTACNAVVVVSVLHDDVV